MAEDPSLWLQEVTRKARETDVLEDARWEAYAAGTLDPEASLALEERAREAGLGEALELLAPSAERDAELLRKLEAHIAPPEKKAVEKKAAEKRPAEKKAAEKKAAEKKAPPARGRAWPLWAGGAIALAAGIA